MVNNSKIAIKESSDTSFMVRPFVLALILFAAINWICRNQSSTLPAIDTIASEGLSNPMARTFTGWTARAYVEQNTAPDVVLFGSSQMGSAVFASDAKTLQAALDFVKHRQGATLAVHLSDSLKQPIRVFNWALGGSMVSDAYLESLCLLRDHLKPKMVVIGLNPRDFIDNSLPSAGATEQFRFFSRFLGQQEDLTDLAFPELLDKFNWILNDRLPLRRIGIQWQHLIAVHNQKQTTASAPHTSSQASRDSALANFMQGISATGVDVQPGQWVMPANMPNIFVDNTKEYTHRYRNCNPPGYASQLQFFQRFLALMKKNDISVLVVGMPSLWPNRALLPDTFWTKWRQHMSTMCQQGNADYLDLTDSSAFVIDDFLDTVHMNALGGRKLFQMLAVHISSQPHLVKKLRTEQSLAHRNAHHHL